MAGEQSKTSLEMQCNNTFGLETDCITLTRFVLNAHKKSDDSCGLLPPLLTALLTAIKAISAAVRKAGFAQLFVILSGNLQNKSKFTNKQKTLFYWELILPGYGQYGTTNIHGDVVQRIDILSNELLINLLKASFACCAIISEETDEPILIDNGDGRFVVSLDPLDGSCNIDVHVTIGSIFGIWEKESPGKNAAPEDLIQPGRKLVAAGYAIYGSATIVVLTTGQGVNGFTLDPSIGAFILSHRNIRIPEWGNIYSTNEAYKRFYTKGVAEWMRHMSYPKNEKCAMSARYVGSFISDLHRTLLKGGIYFYPYMTNIPNGKLRLMYECNPLAMIVEQAGGMASNGKMPILDVLPKYIHQTCPIFIGSTLNVQECLKFLNEFDSELLS